MSVLHIPYMSGYRNIDTGGKPSHRRDRCGKVAMVRLCGNCNCVAWGPRCDGCGAKTDGNGAVDVRQGSLRHLKSVLDAMRADDTISEDAAARIVAEMLGAVE